MKKFIKFCVSGVVIAAMLWFVGFVAFNNTIYNPKRLVMKKTDAIVVLTGGKNRINVAKNLFNDGMAEKMFISGVSKKASIDDVIAQGGADALYKENIEIGQEAKNTVENAIEVDEWIKKNDIKSIRLVTSNYHMPRSIEELKAKNKDVEIVVHPVFSDNVSKKWWKQAGSFMFIANEYNKFLFAWVKNVITK